MHLTRDVYGDCDYRNAYGGTYVPPKLSYFV